MTDNGYLIWLIATAVVTVAVLTIGTLAAAGILRLGRRTEERAPDTAERLEQPVVERDEQELDRHAA